MSVQVRKGGREREEKFKITKDEECKSSKYSSLRETHPESLVPSVHSH